MPTQAKAVDGLTWSFLDNLGTRLLQFVFGILIARLLSPREYGLIGMVTIFIAIAQVFVDSGFSQALLRMKDCRQQDYATVFYFNLLIGVAVYLLVFASSGYIGIFFGEPELVLLLRVICVVLIVNSLTLVQRVTLSRLFDFKTQAKSSFFASIVSYAVAITLAYNGFGVWSLAVKAIIESILGASFLWVFGKFRLSWQFDWVSFKGMFSYSSNLLISGILDCGYNQLYRVIIGKFFNVRELGYYTRAAQFAELPSEGITGIVARVTFPIFAQLEPQAFKKTFKRIQSAVALVVFVLMIGLGAVAPNMIHFLLGEKWMPSVVYLQLLCLPMMLYPIHALNLQILSVKGFSALYLRLEVIKKVMVVPVILVGLHYGIEAMLLGMIVTSLISYFLNTHYSGPLIDYSTLEQLVDLLPILLLAFFMGAIVFMMGVWIPLASNWLLILQLIVGALLVVGIAEIFRLGAYLEIKQLLASRLGLKIL